MTAAEMSQFSPGDKKHSLVDSMLCTIYFINFFENSPNTFSEKYTNETIGFPDHSSSLAAVIPMYQKHRLRRPCW